MEVVKSKMFTMDEVFALMRSFLAQETFESSSFADEVPNLLADKIYHTPDGDIRASELRQMRSSQPQIRMDLGNEEEARGRSSSDGNLDQRLGIPRAEKNTLLRVKLTDDALIARDECLNKSSYVPMNFADFSKMEDNRPSSASAAPGGRSQNPFG